MDDADFRITNVIRGNDHRPNEALHARLLPLILFMTQSVPHLLCYGKRLFASRIGITELHARAPELQPTAFGLDEVRRMTQGWGPL